MKMEGTTTDEATQFMLKKLFSNKLAMTYSWTGGKGKKILSNLTISKIIIRKFFSYYVLFKYYL